MFRRHPQEVEKLVRSIMRSNGLETQWFQRRIIESWDEVAGSVAAQYTEEKSIRNQTLWVKIASPAVRADLNMRRTELVRLLNQSVGAHILSDIRLY